MFVLEKNRKSLVVAGLVVICLIMALCLFYNLVIVGHKSLSPTKEYQVSFNRLSHKITIEQFGTGAKWYEAECYNPTFLWSPNGKYLAENISYPNGNRRAEVWDSEHSSSFNAITKDEIQKGFAETQTQNQDSFECIEITKWLDNRYVTLEFSWPADVPGKNIAGWCVYDFTSHTITKLAVAE
jgi:hypothetical protein